MLTTLIVVAAALLGALTAGLLVARRASKRGSIVQEPPDRPEPADVDASSERDERAALMERLGSIVAELNTELDVDVVLDRITTNTAELLGAIGASFVIVEDDGNRIATATGVTVDWVNYRLAPGEGIFLRAFREDRQIIIEDYQADPDRMRVLDQVGSAVTTPVRVRDEHIGALVLMFAEPGRHVSHAQLEFLRLLVGHAGIAITNARAYGTIARGQALAQEVIDRLVDGVAVLDDEGNVTQWNAAARNLTGLLAQAVIGRPFPWRTGTRAEPAEHQLREDVWVETVVAPLPRAGGAMVVLRDVSRLKALQETENVFLAMVSHELRTPLTVIAGYARRLRDRFETMSPAERETAVEAIRRRTDMLERTVDQLTAGSLADVGRFEVDVQVLDIEPLLRAAAAFVPEASSSHRLAMDIDPNLPRVVADPQAVESVMAQLLENAVKYSPGGGTVTVRAAVTREDVVVSVSDDGIGLAPDEEDRIFDRFTRGTSITRGVGLGLFIVRRLVEAHGGRVWVQRHPTRPGTTFSFTLPRA